MRIVIDARLPDLVVSWRGNSGWPGGRGGYVDRGRGGRVGGGGDRGRGYVDRCGSRGGGFRGGSRVAHGPPTWTRTPLLTYTAADLPRIDATFGGVGWADYPFTSKEDVVLQTYTGPKPILASEIIPVSVNHFPLKNFKLPNNIYHYEVAMERVRRDPGGGDDTSKKAAPLKQQQPPPTKRGGTQPLPDGGASDTAALPPRCLPKPIPPLILTVLLQRIQESSRHYGIVSDLSNNIYSTQRLELLGVPWVHRISMKDVDQTILQEEDDGEITVKITPDRTNCNAPRPL
ncbi:uncharacterized protein LOC118435582 [Folsomia candida]|uniref:uncharacterized protein LOC118435582 n=1 Tax=Folsomia candida TaxID=158441 RepID=UPI001604F676|nr:uncharacterized protein LOC118435582 [Folsomia candida]